MATTSTIPYALVVDDDAVILTDACQILEDAGFRTLCAYNADEALGMISSHGDAVTLLFTDVEMPGSMNGFELARRVAETWREIAILVASGRVQPSDGDLPEKATFVAKPFSSDIVRARLHKVLPDGRKPEPLKTAG